MSDWISAAVLVNN